MFSSVVAAFVLSLPLFGAAEHAGRSRRSHNAIAVSKRNATAELEKRQSFNNARLTFYSTGLGACGQVNHDGDFIVALNTPQFTQLGNSYPSPQCFKHITISCNGKQTGAVIMDECPGCPWGGLDLSPGLFQFFAPESVGVLSATWWFNDGSGGGNNNPPPPPPPPKKTTPPPPPPPPPTTTHEKPTSTPPPPPPSTTKSSTTPPPSSSSSSHSHHSSSSSAAPTPSQVIGGTPDKPENLQGLGYLVVQLGNLVMKHN